MSSDHSKAPPSGVPSAEDLRRMLLEKQLEEMARKDKAREAEEKERSEFITKFMTEHVTEKERTLIRRLVMNAVKDGAMEAMVYSFPAKLCTDGGRAINNGDKAWPSTLQGKAKELYERYEGFAKPQGYRLKAAIINFPDDLPGDVGLFLNWAPEHY